MFLQGSTSTTTEIPPALILRHTERTLNRRSFIVKKERKLEKRETPEFPHCFETERTADLFLQRIAFTTREIAFVSKKITSCDEKEMKVSVKMEKTQEDQVPALKWIRNVSNGVPPTNPSHHTGIATLERMSTTESRSFCGPISLKRPALPLTIVSMQFSQHFRRPVLRPSFRSWNDKCREMNDTAMFLARYNV